MPDNVPNSTVRNSLLTLLDEVMFDGYHFMLDRGASMLETLALVSAEEASTPVSSQSASLAAQVNHVCFYMDDAIEQPEEADWAGSWRVDAVNEEEWRSLIARLRTTTERIRHFVTTHENWDEGYLSKTIAIIAHCAFHLGEIRQGIGVIRDRR